jgi:hypothetical protein
VFTSVSDRFIFKLLLLFTVVGFTRVATEPSVSPWQGDIPFLVFAAGLGWLSFRLGFRTRVVARADGFEVINLFSAHHIPYSQMHDIALDRLTVRLTLRSGRRIRAWGLGQSFLESRGTRGEELVRKLRALVEQRATPDTSDARHSRTWFADWWVFGVLLALFGAALAYGELMN